MIRKFLICGKTTIHLQSRNTEASQELGRVVEVLFPIHDFWEVEKGIARLNYLLNSHSAPVDIFEQYMKILKHSLRFAVAYLDREWLYQIQKPQTQVKERNIRPSMPVKRPGRG